MFQISFNTCHHLGDLRSILIVSYCVTRGPWLRLNCRYNFVCQVTKEAVIYYVEILLAVDEPEEKSGCQTLGVTFLEDSLILVEAILPFFDLLM